MTISVGDFKDAVVLQTGFRLFFLGAAWFALVFMAVWGSSYFFHLDLGFGTLTLSQWHAHELIYGYAGAVIAGFALTAVASWTNRNTLTGAPLLGLFLVWALARFAWLWGGRLADVAGLLDLLFWIGLSLAIGRPIVAAKQWRQLAVLAKLVLLTVGQGIFYVAVLGWSEQSPRLAIYLGLFGIVGLVLMMLRRVFPVFTQAALGTAAPLPCPAWIDRISMAVFLVFLVLFMLDLEWVYVAMAATVMALVLTARLWLWHVRAFWSMPLLLALYVSLVFIVLGFALFAAVYLWPKLYYLAVHAMAFGGVGLVTFAMMARVSLGHTGRNVRASRPLLGVALSCMMVGVLVRVLLPLAWPEYMYFELASSLLLWSVAFVLFLWIYTPMLSRPRCDGLPG